MVARNETHYVTGRYPDFNITVKIALHEMLPASPWDKTAKLKSHLPVVLCPSNFPATCICPRIMKYHSCISVADLGGGGGLRGVGAFAPFGG